ncbi:MAG: B12-binding domain-containing radical SAM protein, partial [Candidatus Omnitrophica bacterium]|nr:B12-binding domain-containing radical SAM protein [Candidatus Omnitrophota bacterium]
LPMASLNDIKEKQQFLVDKVKTKRYLRLKMHNLDMSILETVFSRGDRALSAALEYAWKKGARFDAWSEGFNREIWDEAFSASSINREDYLSEKRPEEALPWGHIIVN